MKRPKDMTDEERRALPLGPVIENVVPLTDEDRQAGMVGKSKVLREYKPVLASYHEPDDIMAWRDDQNKQSYTFGQFLDGSWYKLPAFW